MLTGTRGDAPEPTGHSLVDETPPDQAGMARHHPPGARTRAHPHTRLSASPGRTVERPNDGPSIQREPSRPPRSIERPRQKHQQTTD